MAKKHISINSIFEGQQPSFHFGQAGQFLSSIAIDPDVPVTDGASDLKTGGAIRPVGYAKFSGANVTEAPIAFINNPKNALTYVVLKNGRLISYDSSLGSETLIGTVTGSTASGAFYYNNYIYILGTGASADDISRYGPLSNSPSLTNGVWKGATLGTQTALTNTTYPSTRHSVKYPNHWGHVHVNNRAYFCDFVNGQGKIHYIKTTKTTDEGDTNSGSTYGALDLPFGYMPFDIESYGNNIVIAASQTSDSTINQGKSALFIWDTTSVSFSLFIPLSDPLTTALIYQNGVLSGWSGSLSGGVRFWRYVGGNSIQTLKYLDEGHPPLAGAVESFGNRIVWGGFTTNPVNSASVFAYGSKSDLFPRGLHNIARSTVTATSSNGMVTALKNVQQNGSFPKYLIGATDGTNFNLDKQSTTYQTSVYRSPVFNITSTFRVRQVYIPFGQIIASNMTVVPKLVFDNEQTTATGTTINSTNYNGGQKFVALTENNFTNSTEGKNNFYLELTFSGTALLSAILPIEIELEIFDNPIC